MDFDFAYAFVRENVAYGCDDVMTFESLQPTPFFLDKMDNSLGGPH